NAKQSDDTRLAAAKTLLALRKFNPNLISSITDFLGSKGASPALQRQLIIALGETDDASIGAAIAGAFAKLPPEAQGPAFEVVLRRAEWAATFLDAVKAKK